jgi:hypothetical protein
VDFSGDCATLSDNDRKAIDTAVRDRKAIFPVPLQAPTTIGCGSIVVSVVLPASVSNATAQALASNINNSAISVPGTGFQSTGARAQAIPQHTPGAVGSSGGESSNSGAIIASVVVVLLLLIAVTVGVVVYKKKQAANDNANAAADSHRSIAMTNMNYEVPDSAPLPPVPTSNDPAPDTMHQLYEDIDKQGLAGETFDGFAD